MTKSKGGYRLNKYFTVSESEQFAFYKVPKVLFTDEKYKTVSTDTPEQLHTFRICMIRK